jgi:hypothetical protein
MKKLLLTFLLLLGVSSVAFAQQAPISSDRILGRDTAGVGQVEQLTVGGGLGFSGAGGIVVSDGELTCLAGLSSAADKFPYFTGSGTCALADLSSAMRTFLTTSSSANLGSLLSDDLFLMSDAELGAIAGLTSAADKIPYFTGSGTAALVDGDGDHGDITVSSNFATWSIDADSVALTTDTSGVYVAQVADGTGIDGTANAEAATYTPTLDLTEINSATFGNGGSFTTLTFDAGASDPVWTYSSGVATLSTGELRATNAGTNSASVVTVGGSQTLTSKTLTSPTIGTSPTAAGATWTDLGTVTTADINGGTIDGVTMGSTNTLAIGATTESNIEAAIDTLANLVSVQSLTVTLADAGADAFLAWDDSASAYQNLSATDALTIIKTVDGSGSGLDADLLDGTSSADFLTEAEATSAYQPLDSDLTSIAGLTTTAAGRSVLTFGDPNADRVLAWDDTAGAVAPIALADITDEPAPAAGDYMLVYGAEGDLRKVDWDDLPGAAGGISDIIEDVTPQLGGDLDLNSHDITGTGDINITGTAAFSGGMSIDATTEGNIESAVDTLANLTSVQSRTITLADAGFDALLIWDDSASAYQNLAIANLASEGAPATGDKFLIVGAEGDLRGVDANDMPGGDLVEDTSPQLGGALDANGFGIELGDGNTDTTLVRSAAGEATLEGDAIKHAGRQTVPLLAGAGTIPASGGCSPIAAFDSGSNDVFMRQCSFSASTDQSLYFTFPFPKSAAESTDLIVQVDWTSATGTDTTDDVIWGASAVCFSNDDAINGNAFPSNDTVTDTQTAAGDFLRSGEITAITPAGTPAEGDMCVVRIQRDADAGGDNFNGTAELLNVQLYYTDNASSDD